MFDVEYISKPGKTPPSVYTTKTWKSLKEYTEYDKTYESCLDLFKRCHNANGYGLYDYRIVRLDGDNRIQVYPVFDSEEAINADV